MCENTERVPTLKDYPYMAYLLWDGFVEHAGQLELADLGDPVLAPVLEAARAAIGEHLDGIAAQRRVRIIDQWKADRVYPFQREPETLSEERQRSLFDLVATTAASAVSTKRTQAQLTLRLLREALEDSPAALHRVLRDVLDLTADQIADFDKLLNQSSLSDIIKTTRLVTDRLDFLSDLERMRSMPSTARAFSSEASSTAFLRLGAGSSARTMPSSCPTRCIPSAELVHRWICSVGPSRVRRSDDVTVSVGDRVAGGSSGR